MTPKVNKLIAIMGFLRRAAMRDIMKRNMEERV